MEFDLYNLPASLKICTEFIEFYWHRTLMLLTEFWANEWGEMPKYRLEYNPGLIFFEFYIENLWIVKKLMQDDLNPVYIFLFL